MAKADQIKALIRSHGEGDDKQFYSVALQVAAHAARAGHSTFAQELKKAIEDAKIESKKFTGARAAVPIVTPKKALTGLLTVSYPKTLFIDMQLNTNLLSKLERVVREQKHRARLFSHGFAPISKLLLIGPPGTGKTMTASALAGTLNLPLFKIQLDGLITKFMGETAAKLRLVFDAISSTRGVYLFDEFDALGSQRGTGNDVGNLCHDSQENIDTIDDLSLLTTHHRIQERALTTFGETSGAAAQAARFCARLSSEFPGLGAEAIRGLVVHSARWSSPMLKRFETENLKGKRETLLRRYGYGVPNFGIARKSATNAATMIIQDRIIPFSEDQTMQDIHVFSLPWPIEALEALGDTPVKVRVTLSYFIDPNPRRNGWKSKYSYQSHRLRFKVKRPTETLDTFQKRINKKAREHDETITIADANTWFLGPDARDVGSIHSDVLEGTGVDIAACGAIAVHPTGGWWKFSKKANRNTNGVSYALIVSIETDETETDIWTPITNQIKVKTSITIQ